MFSSKPDQPVQRTTDPVLLKQKAIDFLNKNYTKYNPSEGLPEVFYMLEPNSINGMKRISMPPRHRNFDNVTKQYTSTFSEVSYKNLSDGKLHEPVITRITINQSDPIWYRNSSLFSKSASDAVLGGTRKRRNSRRKSRKQRKSRRR